MRPTHLNIIGRSKFVFNREVQPRIMERYKTLIKKLSAGSKIEFSDRVQSAEDVDNLIGFLVRCGIPRTDIRLRYPSDTGDSKLKAILNQGIEESGLSFGEDVAERDIGLERYFISTKAFEALKSHRKHIVTGPKGSGKSAILRELSNEEDTSLVITPEHYATDVLNAIQGGTAPDDLSSYITTWKYTLLIEIFRKLVSLQHGNAKAVSDLRRYLVSHGHLDDNLTMLERFLAYLRRISQLKGKIGPVEGEIGVGAADDLGKIFKMDELLGLIPSLKLALRKTKFVVFIDELDQSWNNSNTANQFLVSLLTAAIQLRGISDNLHVVVFLRTEIFDLLKPFLPQLDKLRSDIESIRWSRKELMNLIVSRALDSLSINEDIDAESAIKTIFNGVFESSKIPCFDYIISRTSFRPREVIQFCNIALDESIALEQSSISNDAVLRAEEIFSDWKKDHIVSENMYIYPGIDEVLELFRGKPKKMYYEAFDSLLAEMILHAEGNSVLPSWIGVGLEPLEFMRLLYQLEIIGIEKPNSSTEQAINILESYDFAYSRPRGKPELSASILFHPGLWKGLEMT